VPLAQINAADMFPVESEHIILEQQCASIIFEFGGNHTFYFSWKFFIFTGRIM